MINMTNKEKWNAMYRSYCGRGPLDEPGTPPCTYFDTDTREENKRPYVDYTRPAPACIPPIKDVIFSKNATIILWKDKTKTVVKCAEGDVFDPEKGFMLAVTKKLMGNKNNYYKFIKKWCDVGTQKEVNRGAK